MLLGSSIPVLVPLFQKGIYVEKFNYSKIFHGFIVLHTYLFWLGF